MLAQLFYSLYSRKNGKYANFLIFVSPQLRNSSSFFQNAPLSKRFVFHLLFLRAYFAPLFGNTATQFATTWKGVLKKIIIIIIKNVDDLRRY